jgi:wyosine [tRNA(Phe)-imidazoG37] synthetase (radical SAM superfamily)
MAHVTVLSNGTQAARPDVHDALLRVDRNVLKLDTVDTAYVTALDRPRVPYDVGRQVEVFASFKGHVIVQTIFLRGSYMGHSFDNTDDAHVEAWLLALERIRPEGVTIYTVDRDTPASGLSKAPRETLDAIAQRVRALGFPCTVGY